jgi:CRISPR-associated endonuclease/helicase Cas3
MSAPAANAAVISQAELEEADFPAFFKAVHGWEPFPWQETLLQRVLTRGWPALIDVPTGLGKTAVLDVAVFAAALGHPAARRRIFLVVDRRIIVDQAHEHALAIQRALTNPVPVSVCHRVAQRLADDEKDSPVLDVTRMRGGVDWSWLWLERPDRHSIITGTVDQIGSRLLFRGYGVGEQIQPIDAALTGTDSLILIDEAHLADVFVTTLRDIRQLDCAPSSPFPPPVVVAMSASPGGDATDVHRISEADEVSRFAAERLRAPRQLHLVSVRAEKDTASAKMADALTDWARELSAPGRVTGVVVNTVAMARAVFSRLHARCPDGSCMLLTGRIRPVDREYLLHTWLPRIRAGDRQPLADPANPLYMVATQTIEAGADIDLDVLVTESAALPALIQRLGRLNRRGARKTAPVVVLHCSSLPPGVYGDARQKTWKWLEEQARRAKAEAKPKGRRPRGSVPAPVLPAAPVNVSPLSLRDLLSRADPPTLEAMYSPAPYAPLITAGTLATWARTSPIPHPDVPAAPYLHGIDQGSPVVTLAWRGDMHPGETQGWALSSELIPPSADEAIELPLPAVRRWLLGLDTAALADTGAQVLADSDDSPAQRRQSRQVLRYRGPGDAEVIHPGQIRPGDTLLAPAQYGGCDRHGWAPDSAAAVIDVADLAGGTRRRGAAVRVSPLFPDALHALAPGLDVRPLSRLISRIRTDASEYAPDPNDYRKVLAKVAGGLNDAADLPHVRVLRQLSRGLRLTTADSSAGTAVVLTASNAMAGDDTSPAGSSAAGSPRTLTLAEHQEEVAAQACAFARNLQLPEPLVAALTLAGRWHDEGKRDPRFQAMLRGGDRWQVAAMAGELLAKSGMNPADKAAFRRAQRLSRYPSGMRHEDLSAKIAARYLDAGQHIPDLARLPGSGFDDLDPVTLDQDLVVHLIASHHGHGRPLLPPVNDDCLVTIEVPLDNAGPLAFDSASVMVDWDAPDRFIALCERYGCWGLAGLESIVRLADIWCSARPGGIVMSGESS